MHARLEVNIGYIYARSRTRMRAQARASVCVRLCMRRCSRLCIRARLLLCACECASASACARARARARCSCSHETKTYIHVSHDSNAHRKVTTVIHIIYICIISLSRSYSVPSAGSSSSLLPSPSLGRPPFARFPPEAPS